MWLNRRDLIFFSLKVLLAWAALTGLIVFYGEWLLTPLFPLFKAIMISVVSGFSPTLKFIPAVDGGQLKLTVWVLSTVPIGTGIVMPKGIELSSSMHVLHGLVPIAVALSILLVWPVQSWRHKLLLIALGILTSVLILLATVPVLLVALLEMPFQEKAMQANALHQAPWFMDWMIFCEMGGALLLAFIGVCFCIGLQRFVWRMRASLLIG
ncbi:hypothetical protein [Methylomonas sp. AM2-LC]|uniref:hypothetical protein n=1 Tax=Methylomonas sp. AM2-LC TaxID=3153301 RepID=UPI003264A829